MTRWRKVGGGIFYLAREQFWPFILFWAAIFLMKLHPLGGLLSLAFINGEWAVQFWLQKGYSYQTAFFVCAFCANIDLAMWFWFFKKGRFLLEFRYPKAGYWFVQKFDPSRYKFSENDGHVIHFLKSVVFRLEAIFKNHQRYGLVLMGAAPFCGIFVGVPTSVGYKVKSGFWFMALGNTIKIVILGFIIANKVLLVILIILLILSVLLRKTKTPPN